MNRPEDRPGIVAASQQDPNARPPEVPSRGRRLFRNPAAKVAAGLVLRQSGRRDWTRDPL